MVKGYSSYDRASSKVRENPVTAELNTRTISRSVKIGCPIIEVMPIVVFSSRKGSWPATHVASVPFASVRRTR